MEYELKDSALHLMQSLQDTGLLGSAEVVRLLLEDSEKHRVLADENEAAFKIWRRRCCVAERAIPAADLLAQFIRATDGNHLLGASALAENIVQWMNEQSLAHESEPVAHPHITQPYSLDEIRARIESNEYNAELLLQHAMLLLDAAPRGGDEPPAFVWDGSVHLRRELPHGTQLYTAPPAPAVPEVKP